MKMSENQKSYQPFLVSIGEPLEELRRAEVKSYFEWFLIHVDRL